MHVDQPVRQNPFPGLRPFSTEEDYLFFGREEQTTELLGLLREHRFLAVVGTSGSGKSSLVRAGLLPALHGGTMAQAGSAWEVLVLRPGGDPVTNLARALVDAELYDPDDVESLPRIVATLNRSRLGLVEAIKQSELPEGTNLLVVVDQFEELFRFRQAGVTHQEAAAAFVKLLLAAASATGQRIYIAITMRSDYLGECSHIAGLAEAVNAGEYLIPRLSRDQRRAAIEKPVSVGGGTISHRLVQKLLNDVGDDADHLPVLQHALMRIFDYWAEDHADGEPLDLRHYERAGGLQEALSRHSDEAFDELPTDRLRTVAEKLFKALTERGPDNRGIRRPTRIDRLGAIIDAQQEEVVAVVEAFRRSGRTFLMPMSEVELEPHTVIDISHESLMRVWKRLDRWVEEESQSARIYRRLADTAALHAEGKAGTYHDPDLQIALSWRESAQPTEAWAARYHPGFEQALVFLAQSRDVQGAEEQRLEAARERELEQAKKLAAAERLRAQVQKRSAHRLKWLSGGVAVVAGVALIAFGVAIAAWQKSQQLAENEARAAADERTARAEAEEAKNREAKEKSQAEQARAEADLSRKSAEVALQKAEENFAKARSAVNDYLTAVSEDERLKAPGFQGLRVQLLQSALQFYQQFLKERRDDPMLRRELAGVYYKVGEIYRDLNQPPAANRSFAEARRLYEALALESPDDAGLQHGLAMALSRTGATAKAIPILEKLINPADPKYHADLGDLYNNEAVMVAKAKTDKTKTDKTKTVKTKIDPATGVPATGVPATGDPATQLEFLRKSLAVRERLVRLRPDDADARLGIAGSLNNIAIRLKEDRNAEALALIQRAVEHTEAAYRLRPADFLTARYLTIGLNNVAKWGKQAGETEVTLAAHRRRVEVLDRRARDNPTVPGFDAELAAGYASLLLELREAGRWEEAAKTAEKAHVRLAEATEETSMFLLQVLNFRLAVHTLAMAWAKADPDAEVDTEREAAAVVQAMRHYVLAGWRSGDNWMRTDPRTEPLRQRADFKELLVRMDELGAADAKAKLTTATAEEKRAARLTILATLEALAGPLPAARFVRRGLAEARQNWAQALLEAGQVEEARLAFDEALAAREQLVQESPANEQLRADLGQSQSAAGDLFAAAGKLADAIKTWDKALSTLEEGLKTNPNSIPFRAALSERLLHVAAQAAKFGLWDVAGKHYGRAMVVQVPTEPVTWNFIALVAAQTEDLPLLRAAADLAARRSETSGDIGAFRHRVLATSPHIPAAHVKAIRKLADEFENPWHNSKWARSLGYLRAGQAEKAFQTIEGLNPAEKAWPEWQILALIRHRLGHAKEAVQALSQADLLAEKRMQVVVVGDRLQVPLVWDEWLHNEVLRAEAHQLIHGKPMPASAHERLFRGRVHFALEQHDQAEAEFAAAVAIRPDDADVWLTRSRVFAKLNLKDRMAADLLRAQELKGDDPRTWIETGRMLAERGEHNQADTAFARASVLGKGELNRFLEAGWWVVGPYPENLEVPCPPELNPDPSKSVAAVGEKLELKWQAAPATPHTNAIQFPQGFGGQAKASSYALAFVHADGDRTGILHLWPQHDARVWMNGQIVFAGFGEGNKSSIIQIPVTLRKGRNTLLVKNRHDNGVSCECAFLDAPIRRGYELVRLGLWAEAADAFAEADRRDPLREYPSRLRVHALCAAGRDEEARQVFADLVRRHGQPGGVAVSEADLLPPNKSEDRERWLAAIRKFAEEPATAPYRFHRLANACFRAGQFAEAETNLRKAMARDQLYFQPLLASTLYYLGKTDEAKKTLAEMEQKHARLVKQALAANSYRVAQYWEEEVWYQATLREARTLILGKDPGPSADETALLAKARARLAELDSAEDDYARLVEKQPDQPRLWINRGRRLGELKRWQEATKSFDEASQLAPKDLQVWKERAQAHAELGKWDEAAADFVKALELVPLPTEGDWRFPWFIDRAGIDDLLVRWDEVFDRVTRLRPKDPVLWTRRTQHFARLGRWAQAETALFRCLELGPGNHWGPYQIAPLLLARGDVDGCRQIISPMMNRFADTSNWSVAEKVVRTALLVPGEVTDVAALTAMLDRGAQDGANRSAQEAGAALRWIRLARAYVAYRSGDFPGAIHQLTGAGPAMDGPSDQGAETLIVLAMARQQLGESAAAREALAKARAIVEKKAARPELGWLYDNSTWHQWLRCRVLIAEAERLIAKDQVVAEPPRALSPQEQTARRARKVRADGLATQAALAQIRLDVGQKKEAEAELRAVLAERESIAAEESANLDYQADLAAAHESLGQFLVSDGRIEEGVKQTQQAVTLLEQFAAGNPKAARLQVNLAASLFAIADLHWKAGRLTLGRDAWQRALESLKASRSAATKDSKLAKMAVDLEFVAARAYADLGLWTEASGHYRRAFAADPVAGKVSDRFAHAALLVLTGQAAEYGRYCKSVYDRHGNNLQDLWSARMMVLGRGALPDPATVVSLAQGARRSSKDEAWTVLVLALAQLRGENVNAAFATLQEFETISKLQWQYSWPSLAIMRHKAGKIDEAREWLQKTEDWYADQWSKHLAGDGPGLTKGNLFFWAFFLSLRQEAIATVTGQPAPADPWLHLHRGRVYTKLGLPDQAEAEFQAAVKAQPDDPRIVWSRSRIYAGLGKQAEAKADRARAIQLTEQTLAQRPDDSAAADALAMLLIEKNETKWTTLKPLSVKSEGGATLAVQPDDSVLASGVNPDKDVYVIDVEFQGRIGAIRLDVIPDASMPKNGSGRADSGNFILSDFRATAGDRIVAWKRAFADFSQTNESGEKQHLPIAHAIDADQSTGWAIYPKHTEPHWAVFVPVRSLGGDDKVRLTIRLAFQNNDWAKHSLGRFRLSVAGPSELIQHSDWFLAAATPHARVGAAYLAIDDAKGAADFLGKTTLANPKADAVDYLVLALAHASLKDTDRAREACGKAAKLLQPTGADAEVRPLLREVVLALGTNQPEAKNLVVAAAGEVPAALMEAIQQDPDKADGYRARGNWYGERARWNDAVADHAEAFRLEPNTFTGMRLGILLIQTGEIERYRAHCQAMLDRWAATQSNAEADQTLKTVQFLPDSKADATQLARLAEVAVSGDRSVDWFDWYLVAKGLHDYRTGKYADALAACRESRRLAPASKGSPEALSALNLAIEAMALLRTGDATGARSALTEAKSNLDFHVPGIDAPWWHDWLAAHILYREAEGVVAGLRESTGMQP